VHDGFTLADLYSYDHKRNEANGEDNRDGSDHNFSFNCGYEGPTDDPQIVALRRQLRKNQLACLLLAQGVPLILAGDEVGNTQHGNNNPYCQDNEIGWTKWSNLGVEGENFVDFIGGLAKLRKRFPQLTPRHWVRGKQADGSFGVLWLRPDAQEMTEADWNFAEGRYLAYVLGPLHHGGQALFIVLNAAPLPIDFALPRLEQFKSWTLVLHTGCDHADAPIFPAGARSHVPPRTVLAFEGSS